MSYQEIEVNGQKHIIVDLGDGAFKSFPVDENNPEYVVWLESQTPPKTTKSK
jgi:hypothetical protein